MKIEPFPWLRDYYVDMNKLYTELIVEKIENEMLGEKKVTLKGYEEMFKSKGRDKILIKGDPGMGKTTLGTKIGFDWVKEMFNVFSIVFFIFLKYVQPDEAIEDVILKQNPELEGLGVSVEKLREILDRFSERCLLIFDGLDEHGLGKNQDVLKIIRNEKLIKCGIIVSSRPHSTRDIKVNFTTEVRVDGFNKKQAKRFVSNFFTDRNKIKQIMRFRPSDSREKYPIQQCLILLSFFCFLVAEQDIDLSDKTISMDDIYTRLVKCLYKKFMIRRNAAFKDADFYEVMKSLGKLAFKTLTLNNPLLQRAEVLEMVGDFAFEYGLFAGHEDIRLCGDPTADLYVTYPHRSLEEFLGSFGFIQVLCEGKTLDDILDSYQKELIFMVNPLVWKFSLWFLSTPDFDFLKRDECYDKLTSYVAECVDFKVFTPHKIGDVFAAIDMLDTQLEHSTLKFFRDSLNKCKHVTILYMTKVERHTGSDDSKVVAHILGLMNRDFFDRLTKIIIDLDKFKLKETDNKSLIWSINTTNSSALQIMNLLFNKCENPQIYLRIYYFFGNSTDITPLSCRYVKHLYIGSSSVAASGEFPHCPILTHLPIQRQDIGSSVSTTLKRAIQSGKLPRLRRVTMIKCDDRGSRSDWLDQVKVTITDDENEANLLKMFKFKFDDIDSSDNNC